MKDNASNNIVVPTAKSKPVVICPYQTRWPTEFVEQAQFLRQACGQSAERIDHIGSTSVPGLAAKDIIDIQITVTNLKDCNEFISRMKKAGLRQRGDIRYDNLVGHEQTALTKLYFREADGNRRVHMHVRQRDSINQQYPLLFRDYLRNNEQVRTGYELLKQRLAAIYPDNIEGYLFIKDPLMDVIYQGARHWAAHTGWVADNQHY